MPLEEANSGGYIFPGQNVVFVGYLHHLAPPLVYMRRSEAISNLICNQWVAGSIPVAGSNISAGQTKIWPAFFIFAMSAKGLKTLQNNANYHTKSTV